MPKIARPSIARSTASMSVATMLSRVTGFARDATMAFVLGATLLSSSYVVANNIPNMIFEFVAGGVISAVFLPVYIERLEHAGEESAWRFASSVMNVALLALGVVAVLGTVFSQAFVRTQMARVTGPEAARFLELGTFFFRFFAVQVVIYGAHAVATGILNAHRRFFAPSVAPVLNNLALIAVFLLAVLPFRDSNPRLAEVLLAAGTTLGVLVMFLALVPSLRQVGIRYTPTIDWHDPGLMSMGRKMIATGVYVGTNLVAVSMRNAYSLRAIEGGQGPAAIRYAWMFYQLPYGVLAVSLAMAFLPELSTAASRRDISGFKRQYMSGLSATGLLMLPAAALIIGLAEPLVTLLRSGRFSAEDVPLVAGVLRFWVLGLFSYAAYMFTLRTFYSLQDTRTPTITNIPATAVQIGLYSVLTLGIAGWSGLGLAGIGAADSAFYTLHFIVLWLILRRRLGPMNASAFASSVARVVAASLAAGLVAWGTARALQPLADASRLGFLAQLVLGGALGLAAAIGASAVLRVPELDIARSMLTRVFGRLLPRRRP